MNQQHRIKFLFPTAKKEKQVFRRNPQTNGAQISQA